jgi:fructosamine-3-kinase
MTSILPEAVRVGVLAALRERRGADVRLEAATPVDGGSINRAARLALGGGDRVFVKWNPDPLPGMFPAEADGLRALAEPGALRVPEVLGVAEPAAAPAWLLLEYLPETGPAGASAETLGRGLAALHRSSNGDWGWHRDNYIGSLPQANRPLASWATFWRDRRLAPQVRHAVDHGLFQADELAPLERVLDRLDMLLDGADDEGPSLVHGDLWSGNAYTGPAGAPVIVDPAVYLGHREVDLAMSEVFGGFPLRFYEAYDEVWPVHAAYRARRRDCYQLYYLLVHVNLFGRGYVSGTLARAQRLAM